VRRQNVKKQFASFHAKVRSTLSTADAAILDKVVEAFAAFQAAEEDRVYQLHIDGSIRGIAAARQPTLAGERFRRLMSETVEQHELKPADENILKAVDDELNRVYREGLRRYQETVTRLFTSPGKEGMYTTLRMSTGLTFGSISALFGLSHGIIDTSRHS
jgi:hypothetical protein